MKTQPSNREWFKKWTQDADALAWISLIHASRWRLMCWLVFGGRRLARFRIAVEEGRTPGAAYQYAVQDGPFPTPPPMEVTRHHERVRTLINDAFRYYEMGEVEIAQRLMDDAKEKMNESPIKHLRT